MTVVLFTFLLLSIDDKDKRKIRIKRGQIQSTAVLPASLLFNAFVFQYFLSTLTLTLSLPFQALMGQ